MKGTRDIKDDGREEWCIVSFIGNFSILTCIKVAIIISEKISTATG